MAFFEGFSMAIKEVETGKKDASSDWRWQQSEKQSRAIFCFLRIRPLGNYHGIALINRIVDIVVIMTHHGSFVKTKGNWQWYISRLWSSSSFKLQLPFTHILMQCSIVLLQVLNSILKSVENRHFDINIVNLNQNRQKPTIVSSSLIRHSKL